MDPNAADPNAGGPPPAYPPAPPPPPPGGAAPAAAQDAAAAAQAAAAAAAAAQAPPPAAAQAPPPAAAPQQVPNPLPRPIFDDRPVRGFYDASPPAPDHQADDDRRLADAARAQMLLDQQWRRADAFLELQSGSRASSRQALRKDYDTRNEQIGLELTGGNEISPVKKDWMKLSSFRRTGPSPKSSLKRSTRPEATGASSSSRGASDPGGPSRSVQFSPGTFDDFSHVSEDLENFISGLSHSHDDSFLTATQGRSRQDSSGGYAPDPSEAMSSSFAPYPNLGSNPQGPSQTATTTTSQIDAQRKTLRDFLKRGQPSAQAAAPRVPQPQTTLLQKLRGLKRTPVQGPGQHQVHRAEVHHGASPAGKRDPSPCSCLATCLLYTRTWSGPEWRRLAQCESICGFRIGASNPDLGTSTQPHLPVRPANVPVSAAPLLHARPSTTLWAILP